MKTAITLYRVVFDYLDCCAGSIVTCQGSPRWKARGYTPTPEGEVLPQNTEPSNGAGK